MFYEEKYQNELSFTYNKLHAASFTNKTGFTRRKIQLQVLRTEKSTCNKFRDEGI